MDDLHDLNFDLNQNPSLLNNNKDIDETIKNWNSFSNNVNTQISTMWNFVLYNQFNNEEIRRLHNEMNGLNTNINNLKKNNKYLCKENHDMKLELKLLNPSDNQNKRKRKINYLRNEFNKNKKNKNDEKDIIIIEEDTKNDLLLRTFESLENITDIINLKNNTNKFDFINDKKFVKLYNLIPCLEELNEIIGMDNVKDTIFKSICYFLHGINNSNELNHVMICGPPGVGKTTIAQIIGKIYLELGFLDNDIFKTASRSDLIAKYLGQTAIKTQKLIDSVIGGVLFIDEVYSLGNEEKRDSFAKECIDTINLNMTGKEPWLLIIGGYKEDIYNSFMCYNKGLERRFTVKLEINNYSPEELFKILLKFVKDDGFKIEDMSITIDDINDNKDHFKFYAGDMLKLYQKAKEFYSLRLMKKSLTLSHSNKILIRDDFIKSLNHFKINKKDNNMYNFSMYT